MVLWRKVVALGWLLASGAAVAEPSLGANLNKRLPEPYVNEVLQATPALKLGILALLGDNGMMDKWVVTGFTTGNLVVTPIKTFEAGKTVVTGTFCEPHNCGDTQWHFAYEPQSQALMLVNNQSVLINQASKAWVSGNLARIIKMSQDLDRMDWQ